MGISLFSNPTLAFLLTRCSIYFFSIIRVRSSCMQHLPSMTIFQSETFLQNIIYLSPNCVMQFVTSQTSLIFTWNILPRDK